MIKICHYPMDQILMLESWSYSVFLGYTDVKKRGKSIRTREAGWPGKYLINIIVHEQYSTPVSITGALSFLFRISFSGHTPTEKRVNRWHDWIFNTSLDNLQPLPEERHSLFRHIADFRPVSHGSVSALKHNALL